MGPHALNTINANRIISCRGQRAQLGVNALAALNAPRALHAQGQDETKLEAITKEAKQTGESHVDSNRFQAQCRNAPTYVPRLIPNRSQNGSKLGHKSLWYPIPSDIRQNFADNPKLVRNRSHNWSKIAPKSVRNRCPNAIVTDIPKNYPEDALKRFPSSPTWGPKWVPKSIQNRCRSAFESNFETNVLSRPIFDRFLFDFEAFGNKFLIEVLHLSV